MLRILTLTICTSCKGRGYQPTEEEIIIVGWKYPGHKPCDQCDGSGKAIKWIDLDELARLLDEIGKDKPTRKGIL